jgi:[ribosomal protein S5]-alanine N-acetyltransferase
VKPPVLRTERLVLRPYRATDLDALHEYRGHPEWARYLPLPQPYTLAQAALDLDEYVHLDAATHAFWAIEHDGRAVGNIDAELQAPSRALAGWGIARHLWGQGLTTEAARAVMDWSFETWPIRRFYAQASARNVGSWRVMENLGMQREARLRMHREDQGVPADEVWYAILRGEWEARIKPR